jgi:hypothetical protein
MDLSLGWCLAAPMDWTWLRARSAGRIGTGSPDGLELGSELGVLEGLALGFPLGISDGRALGMRVGPPDGSFCY